VFGDVKEMLIKIPLGPRANRNPPCHGFLSGWSRA
jgi:hypothetical protein